MCDLLETLNTVRGMLLLSIGTFIEIKMAYTLSSIIVSLSNPVKIKRSVWILSLYSPPLSNLVCRARRMKTYSFIPLAEAVSTQWSRHSQLLSDQNLQNGEGVSEGATPPPAGSKGMFSVSSAVEGNNKNNLKWWFIHYTTSPLFSLFPLCLQKHSRKYALSFFPPLFADIKI